MSRPVVALDASQVVLEARTGNRRTWLNLIPALARAAPDLDFVAWMGYWRAVPGSEPPLWAEPNVRNRSLRLPRRLIEAAWDRGLLSTECILPRARIFHGIFRYLPPSRRCARLITVYDIREVLFPELYPTWERTRERLSRDLRRARLVVAPSRAVAREIQEHFPVEPERLAILRAGAVEPLFFQPPSGRHTLDRLGVRPPYLVTIGSGDPRKNIPRLARAFTEYRRSTGADLRLVVVGAPHRSYGEIPPDSVTFTDLVDDEAWRDLLHFSEGLVYPSLYEGFGLPALEALAAGTVLLASRAVPVAAEDLAAECLLFDPRSEEAMVRALQDLAALSPERRQHLLEAGRARAAEFTWDRVARGYVSLYRRFLP